MGNFQQTFQRAVSTVASIDFNWNQVVFDSSRMSFNSGMSGAALGVSGTRCPDANSTEEDLSASVCWSQVQVGVST